MSFRLDGVVPFSWRRSVICMSCFPLNMAVRGGIDRCVSGYRVGPRVESTVNHPDNPRKTRRLRSLQLSGARTVWRSAGVTVLEFASPVRETLYLIIPIAG